MKIRDRHVICRWTAYLMRLAGLGVLGWTLVVGLNQERLLLATALFLGSIAFRPRKGRTETIIDGENPYDLQ